MTVRPPATPEPPGAFSLPWLERIRANFGEENVEVRVGYGPWAGYRVVYLRYAQDMPWRFSGNAYRAGDVGLE